MDPTLHEPTFSTVEVVTITGATYRQIDYWVRIGLLSPLSASPGSGGRRRFRRRDVIVADVIKAIYAAGANIVAANGASREIYLMDHEPSGHLVVTETGEVIEPGMLLDLASVDAFGWLIPIRAADAMIEPALTK